MPHLSESFNPSADPNTPSMTVNNYGAKEWRLPTGELHREDGPAVEVDIDGTKYWYHHDQLHREDGPAFECTDGRKQWYRHGQCHREDGPATESADGTKQWYLNDKKFNENQFNQWREERAKTRQADITVFTTGLDKPILIATGKLRLRVPTLR